MLKIISGGFFGNIGIFYQYLNEFCKETSGSNDGHTFNAMFHEIY